MINISKIFVFVSMIAMCLAQEKNCKMSQLDSKMRPLTRAVGEVIWPQSEKDMDELCRTFPGYFTSARNYMKKCAKGETKTILSVSIHAIDKMNVKLFCKNKNKSDRKKFIASGSCASSGKKAASKCWTKMISQMTAVSNVTDAQNKFPLLCCSLLKWKDCFIKVYEDLGQALCPTDQIEYMDQYLYKSMIDPMNIFCADYDESDKCNKFDKFFATSQSGKVKYFTPFPAIINLFESL